MRSGNWGWRALGGLCACAAACGGSVSHEPGQTASGGSSGTSGMSYAGAYVMAAGGNGGPGPATGTGGKQPGGAGGKGGAASAGTSSGGKAPIGGGVGPNGCPGNQISVGGKCLCPAYAPEFCALEARCVNASKDPEHCGDCDVQCGATNACAVGECTPDLESVSTLAGCGTLLLQQLPDKLYALGTSSGKLYWLPKSGGAPATLASGLGSAAAFALDATNAYVAAGASVVQVNLTSGAKTVLVTEAFPVVDVAVEKGKIYYAVGQYIKQADATTPGAGTAVAQSIDEGEAYGVTVAGGQVLYVSNASFNVEADPIASEQHVKIAASQGALLLGHRSIQADATHVYWANAALQSAPFVGVEPFSTTVAQPVDGASIVAFAVDSPGKIAYFGTAEGTFEKSTFADAEAGNEATPIARSLTKVTSVVLDASFVYLADGCKILKTAR